jgi:hypothetical protein
VRAKRDKNALAILAIGDGVLGSVPYQEHVRVCGRRGPHR